MATVKQQSIDVDLIIDSPLNPRRTYDPTKLNELAASIREVGVQQPVKVRQAAGKPGRFELVYGHRRVRAVRLARMAEVPALVAELTDQQVLEEQLVENGQRDDVHPLDEADAYKRLHEEYKLAVDELAAKVGKDKSYVYKRLKLCALGPEARESFLAGRITPAVAYLVARVPAQLQVDALELTSERGATEPLPPGRVAENFRRQLMADLARAPFDTKSATLVAAAGPCTTCPKRTGNQPDLFGDVKGKDICTDVRCFVTKRDVANKARLAEAAAAGTRVLSKADAKEAFRWGGTELDTYRYTTLDGRCYQDPKNRTYKQLLGATAPVVLAKDPAGNLRELLCLDDAKKALREAGHKFAQPAKSTPDPYLKKRRAEGEKSKALLGVAHVAINKIAALVAEGGLGRVSVAVWAHLAREAANHWCMTDDAAKAFGATSKKALVAQLPSLNLAQLQGVVVAKELLGHLPGHLVELPKEFLAICATAGIDLAQLQLAVAADAKKPAAKPEPKAHLHEDQAGDGEACIVPMCNRARTAKHLCQTHYAKAKRLKFDTNNALPAAAVRKLAEDGRTARDAGEA